MPKKQRCPICFTKLVSAPRSVKMMCPTEGCEFIDRRNGNTVVNPELDRRGREIEYANPKDDPWFYADFELWR